MNLFGRVSVFPSVPARISRLTELANNLWWVWNPEAQRVFAALDAELWESLGRNPVKLLCEVRQDRLDAVSADADFLARYDAVLAEFDAYLNPTETWFSRHYPQHADRRIAYFSAEFGLHESLPIYSGGLGILAGDHCKSASDLGVPLVGVGLLYNQGYFRQRLSPEGKQEATYEKLDFNQLPLTPAQTPDGDEVVVGVDLPGRRVYAKVWQVAVGRISLYLLDTDIDRNAPEDRRFSAQLYGGDYDMRISQEIILGIGGVRALRALDLYPAMWHLNEGHAAFIGLERARELVQTAGLTFYEAVEAVAANSVFTTHTPVPAGNDAFPFDMMERYFRNFWAELRLNRDEFLALARQDQMGGPALFSMTVLALRTSRRANGVSKLHGEVSRDIWKDLWPGVPVDEVPITSITNGVHTGTWLAPELADLLDQHAQGWRDHVEPQEAWEGVGAIPDDRYWEARRHLKCQMIEEVRRRLRIMRLRHGESPARLREVDSLLNPDALTIGFARRFATYKRANLIFRDMERIKAILASSDRPVQILFAGKAHPADEPGKRFIQQIDELSRQPGFEGKVIMIEDYDMHLARYLVRGVDLWLNNPRRPMEASGTSGQKAALNGVLNFSVLDGWWVEGFNGENGWSIGEEREYKNTDEQDDADSQSLYQTLEDVIIPLYFDRDAQGVPHLWIRRSKEAIRTLGPVYSTRRMVQDYARRLYVPAIEHGQRLAGERYSLARSLAHWKGMIRLNWHHIHLEARGPREQRLTVGDQVEVEAWVRLGGLDPAHFVVEICQGRENPGAGGLAHLEVVPMQQRDRMGEGIYAYWGALQPRTGGTYSYGVRVRPSHPDLLSEHEVGLIRWA